MSPSKLKEPKVRKVVEIEALKIALASNFDMPAETQIGYVAWQLGKSVAWVKRQLELAS